jgi:outer membrane protein TolC
MTSLLEITVNRQSVSHRLYRYLIASALLAALDGCAQVPPSTLQDVAPELAARVPLPEEQLNTALATTDRAPTDVWDGVTPLSADLAVRCALSENRMLRRTLTEADRRAALFRDAQLPPNPTLSAALGAPLNMGVVPVLAMIAGQIDWIWKRDAIVGEADAQLRSVLLESATMVMATVVETRAAYIDAVSVSEQARLASRDEQVALRVLKAEEAALATGQSTRKAVLRARMNAAEASNRVLTAEVARVESMTRLLEAIGRGDHHLNWHPAAADTASAVTECKLTLPPRPDDDAELTRLVDARRFDVRAAQARADGADARAQLAATGRLPTLMLGGGYERDMENDSAAMFMLESRIPLFNDSRFLVSAAEADADIARIDADRIRQRALIDVRRAAMEVVAAEHHSATLRDQTLAAYTGLRSLLASAVEAGESAPVDLWRAEHQENHILFQLLQAERSRALSTLAFERALAGGRLPIMGGGMLTPTQSGSMSPSSTSMNLDFTALEEIE